LNNNTENNTTRSKTEKVILLAQQKMEEQAQAISSVAKSLDNNFLKAVELLYRCKGRVIISGMGKSGHVGKKLAASLASTGTPAMFMHPGEAYHGDLGMVTTDDIVILLSNSGESDEILKLIPHLHFFGNTIISIHGNINSTLAKNSDINLLVEVEKEICPNNLAPTTSTIVAMAMADALTVSLMDQRGFQDIDFARYHPGGTLGKRLLKTVSDNISKVGLLSVTPNTTMETCLKLMTKSQTGIIIIEEDKILQGVLTDGDIRRSLLSSKNILEQQVKLFMNSDPISIDCKTKVFDAEKVLKSNKINNVIVTEDAKAIGFFSIGENIK